MTLGDCQVTKGIGTAPAQNPNQEYPWLEDDAEVFCEDEQRMMPASDCRQCGAMWYSNEFLLAFEDEFGNAFSELEYLHIQRDRFVRGDSWDIEKVRIYSNLLNSSTKELLKRFEKVAL